MADDARKEMPMPRPMKIDFVSDVSCPWCVIGLRGLEEALAKTGDVVEADIHFQPFELNPDMPAEGRNVVEHLTQAYGAPPTQIAANRAAIKERAAALGFEMAMSEQSRMWNTFDAHRLLHWAEQSGRQHALKNALFQAYHSDDRNLGDPDVLVAAAEKAGLDGAAAREVLASGLYAEEVRQAEYLWQSRGITGVPAVIIDERYLVSGGQTPEAYEQVIRQIAAQAA
jgi:predicted DsbA family dithiol-disulfide isomerase